MNNQANLYADLPPRSYSMEEFISHSDTLFDMDTEEFIRFTLTGEVPGDHQAVVDPLRNFLNPAHQIFASRDYDSVIGITDDIAVDCPLTIYPVNNPADALRTSIHIKRSIEDGERTISIPYHKIPNAKLGMWGNRHSIYIFFPRLALDEERSPLLSEDEVATFYEKGLRPYINHVQPEISSDWPPDYNSEKFRAGKRGGQRAFRTVMLSTWLANGFAANLREQLQQNGVEWAEDFFLLHTIRGIKHTTEHVLNGVAAHLTLTEVLKEAKISLETTLLGSWWVDVGIEFCNMEGECLQWMTASHRRVVEDALQISASAATRITTLGSSKYSRDLASHLSGVSGCRIEPGLRAEGPYQVAYLQLYTTDKSVTYQIQGRSHAKEATIGEIMGTEQPAKFVKDLYSAYTEAAKHIRSNARMEVRVPIRFASEVLVYIDNTTIKESILSFPMRQWWHFRAYRLLAITNTLKLQAIGPPKLRIRSEALLLTAACLWLINGLHARPDDGPSSRSLMRAILPLTDEDDHLVLAHSRRGGPVDDENGADGNESDGEEFVAGTPYYPYGAIFLRRMKSGPADDIPVPRMRQGGPVLSTSAFKFFFKASEAEIRHKYFIVGIVPQASNSGHRPSNRAKCTLTYVTQPGVPEPILFHLAENGHRLPTPPIDNGSDNEDDPRARGFGNGNINQDISTLWRQFFVDVINKSPNPRRGGLESYCKLTRGQRLEVQEEFYMNTDLSQVWNACQWRVGEQQEWDRAFGHLFPQVGHQTPGNVQNYLQCQYYRYWKEVTGLADNESADATRQSIKSKVFALGWIPDAAQDKMWPTKENAKRFNRYPPGSTGPAPRILLRQMPTW